MPRRTFQSITYQRRARVRVALQFPFSRQHVVQGQRPGPFSDFRQRPVERRQLYIHVVQTYVTETRRRRGVLLDVQKEVRDDISYHG